MQNTLDPIAPAARSARPVLPPRRPPAPNRLQLRPVEVSAVEAVRFRVGSIEAAYRGFPTQRTVTISPNDSQVYVILPAFGTVIAVTAVSSHEVAEGEALLLARTERVSCVWKEGSAGLILRIPRTGIQAEAARLFEEPRRLASIVSTFEWSDRPIVLAGSPLSLKHFDNHIGQTEMVEPQQEIFGSLVRAIISIGEAAFPVAKSVLRALAYVRAHPQGVWTVEDLAPIAGVTAATLRKNFRACLGLTITQVVRQTRLNWVRQQLGSPHDSRSIARLAEAAGFGDANLLARAYQQRFGETATQTRRRAFTGA